MAVVDSTAPVTLSWSGWALAVLAADVEGFGPDLQTVAKWWDLSHWLHVLPNALQWVLRLAWLESPGWRPPQWEHLEVDGEESAACGLLCFNLL